MAPGRKPQVFYPQVSHKSLANKVLLAQVIRVGPDGLQLMAVNGISCVVPPERLGLPTGTHAGELYALGQYLAVRFVEGSGSTRIFSVDPGDFKQPVEPGRVIQVQVGRRENNGYFCSLNDPTRGVTVVLPDSGLAGYSVQPHQIVLARVVRRTGGVAMLSLELDAAGAEDASGRFVGEFVTGRLSFAPDARVGVLETPDRTATYLAEFQHLRESLHARSSQRVRLQIVCVDQFSQYIYCRDPYDTSGQKRLTDFLSAAAARLGRRNILVGARFLRQINNDWFVDLSAPCGTAGPTDDHAPVLGQLMNFRQHIIVQSQLTDAVFNILKTNLFDGYLIVEPVVDSETKHVVQIPGHRDMAPADVAAAVARLDLSNYEDRQLNLTNKQQALASIRIGDRIQVSVHITRDTDQKLFGQIRAKGQKDVIDCQIFRKHLTTQALGIIDAGFTVLNILSDGSLELSQLAYKPSCYCLNKDDIIKVGQVSQGAVTFKSQYTYLVEFYNNIKVQIPIFAGELTIGKVYNFVVTNSDREWLQIKHTNLEASREPTVESLMEVYEYKYLQQLKIEDNTVKSVPSNEFEIKQVIGVCQQGFLIECDGANAILPAALIDGDYQKLFMPEKIVAHLVEAKQPYELDCAVPVCIIGANPLIVSVRRFQQTTMVPKQRYTALPVFFASSYVVFRVPHIPYNFRCSKVDLSDIVPYMPKEIVAYEAAGNISNCYNCRCVEWQIQGRGTRPTQPIRPEGKRRFQLLQTEDINHCESVEQALYQEQLRGYKLIPVCGQLLRGDLVDLGNGIIGFLPAVGHAGLADDTEYHFTPLSKLTFQAPEHFKLIELTAGEDEFLEVVLLRRRDTPPTDPNTPCRATIVHTRPDYFVAIADTGPHTGEFILCHFTDYCRQRYDEFRFKQGQQIHYTEEQCAPLRLCCFDVSQCLSDTPMELQVFQGSLRYLKFSTQRFNSVYLCTALQQPERQPNNEYCYKALLSLDSNSIPRIPVYNIPSFDVCAAEGCQGFYTVYSQDEATNTLSLMDYQLPQSAAQTQVGDILVGFITFIGDSRIYLKVSRGLSCQIFDYNLAYPGERNPLAQFVLLQRVEFRVIKTLFKDCVAGNAQRFFLERTFCLRDDIRERQLHVCQVRQVAGAKIFVEIVDTLPNTFAVVPFNFARQDCNREKLASIFQVGSFYHCVVLQAEVVDGRLWVQCGLSPECFVEAGIDPGLVRDLNVAPEDRRLMRLEAKRRAQKMAELGDKKITEDSLASDAVGEPTYATDAAMEHDNPASQSESMNFDQAAGGAPAGGAQLNMQLIKDEDDEGEESGEEIDDFYDPPVQFLTFTPNDFEKALMKEPYSSYIYISYCNYYIRQNNLQQANQVLQRALDSIPILEKVYQQERTNIHIAQLNIVEKYEGTDALLERLLLMIKTFEAPAVLCRQLTTMYLGRLNSANGKQYLVVMERMFKQLFISRRRKRDISNMRSYADFLFAAGKQLGVNFEEIAGNLDGGSATRDDYLVYVAEQFYRKGQIDRGHALFKRVCGNYKQLDQLVRWCDCVEKYCDTAQIRDFYQQLVKGDFHGSRRTRNLGLMLRRFYQFEKERGGELEYVQGLAAKLIS